MSPYTKEPRRKLYLVMTDWIMALGGYKIVAASCLVSVESVNKWKQDPDGNGQDIPVKHLQTLLALTGTQLTNLAAQNAADELIQDHLLSLCFRRAYLEEKVFAMVELLTSGTIASRKTVNE